MLKFGKLYDYFWIAEYLERKLKSFSVWGAGRGLSTPTLNFETPLYLGN